jgi:hypothetical protein
MPLEKLKPGPKQQSTTHSKHELADHKLEEKKGSDRDVRRRCVGCYEKNREQQSREACHSTTEQRWASTDFFEYEYEYEYQPLEYKYEYEYQPSSTSMSTSTEPSSTSTSTSTAKITFETRILNMITSKYAFNAATA